MLRKTVEWHCKCINALWKRECVTCTNVMTSHLMSWFFGSWIILSKVKMWNRSLFSIHCYKHLNFLKPLLQNWVLSIPIIPKKRFWCDDVFTANKHFTETLLSTWKAVVNEHRVYLGGHVSFVMKSTCRTNLSNPLSWITNTLTAV